MRDWRIYADFAQSLIGIARPLYAQESFGVDLQETVYALDATTIDLCLSVFPWAPFRSAKAAIKVHTLLDLRGNIPTFMHISDGKMHRARKQSRREKSRVSMAEEGYPSRLCKCNNFNVNGPFGRDRRYDDLDFAGYDGLKGRIKGHRCDRAA